MPLWSAFVFGQMCYKLIIMVKHGLRNLARDSCRVSVCCFTYWALCWLFDYTLYHVIRFFVLSYVYLLYNLDHFSNVHFVQMYSHITWTGNLICNTNLHSSVFRLTVFFSFIYFLKIIIIKTCYFGQSIFCLLSYSCKWCEYIFLVKKYSH